MDDINNYSDEDLVKLALENQDKFGLIVERYSARLLNYIFRITNVSQEEAEDILQEVLIKIYINLNDFDSGLKFSSWVYRITHNQVISNFRKKKARPEGYTINLEDNVFNNIADNINIEKETDRSLLKSEMERVLIKIDKKYREVLVLKFLEEKTYTEISDIIKRPMGTVASLINKAKKELAREITKLRNSKII